MFLAAFLAAMPATLRHEIARKTIHIVSAAIPAAYALGAPRAAVVLALALAGVAAAGVEVARARSAHVRATFDRLVGPLLRPHEHGRWSGATWMCAAYLIVALVFPRREAVAAMLAVAFGDAAAAVVGRLAGRRNPPRAAGAKTWAGSVACFAATTLGALVVARLSAPAAVACGAAAMLAERPRWAVDDNMRIAVAAGAAAWGAAWALRAM